MRLTLSLALTAIALSAAARADDAELVYFQAADAEAGENSAEVDVAAADQKREQARTQFIAARTEFEALLHAILTSDEFAVAVHDLGDRIQERRAEKRLKAIQSRLETVEAEGRAETQEAERLRTRAAALTSEVEQAKNQDARADAEKIKAIMQVVAARLREAMGEKTEYDADISSLEQLEKRTKRMRRLTAIARVASSFWALRAAEQRGESEEATQEDINVPQDDRPQE